MIRPKIVPVRNLVRYSLLAVLAAMSQVSAALFPGPGYILSAFSTLPIAIAAYINPTGGVYAAITAAWLTFMIQPVEVLWLLLNTAPLGLVIGAGLFWLWKPYRIVIAGTVIFTSSLLFTTYILGIPSFENILGPAKTHIVLMFFAGFAALYTFAWLRFITKYIHRLERFLKGQSATLK